MLVVCLCWLYWSVTGCIRYIHLEKFLLLSMRTYTHPSFLYLQFPPHTTLSTVLELVFTFPSVCLHVSLFSVFLFLSLFLPSCISLSLSISLHLPISSYPPCLLAPDLALSTSISHPIFQNSVSISAPKCLYFSSTSLPFFLDTQCSVKPHYLMIWTLTQKNVTRKHL